MISEEMLGRYCTWCQEPYRLELCAQKGCTEFIVLCQCDMEDICERHFCEECGEYMPYRGYSSCADCRFDDGEEIHPEELNRR